MKIYNKLRTEGHVVPRPFFHQKRDKGPVTKSLPGVSQWALANGGTPTIIPIDKSAVPATFDVNFIQNLSSSSSFFKR